MKRLIALTTAIALATVAYTSPSGTATEASTASQAPMPAPVAPVVTVLNGTALAGLGSGSTIGPDGALYVTSGNKGTLIRVNPTTGSARVVGRGLPRQTIGIGGAMDVAFIGDQPFVLVTAAGSDWGDTDAVMGIYRLRRDGSFSVFADLGAWSAEHPPADPDWFASQGVQYSLDAWRSKLLVTDAHLGRVIRVSRLGRISELVAFDSTDSVPLGLAVHNGKVFVTTAGPIPHPPSASALNVVRRNGSTKVVGKWAADYTGNLGLLIDAEENRGHMYGLLQGYWDLEPTFENEGFPAKADTGAIVVVGEDGTFKPLVRHLNQPTSLELVGHVGFVVTVTGKIMRIDGL